MTEKQEIVVELSNAADPVAAALCKDYWETGADGKFVRTVAELAKAHDMEAWQLPGFVREHSNAYINGLSCSICFESATVSSRSDWAAKRPLVKYDDWVCADCKNEIEEARQAMAAQQEQQKQAKIADFLLERYESLLKENEGRHLFELLDRNALLALALIRHSASEDMQVINPVSSQRDRLLAPDAMPVSVVKELVDSAVMVWDPDMPASQLEDLRHEPEADTMYYRPMSTQFRLVLDQSKYDYPRSVEMLTTYVATHDFMGKAHSDVMDLASQLQRAELMAYLKHVAEKHSLSISPGEKTATTIHRILEHFSVAQGYNLIWRAAKDAAAYRTRERIPARHAGNTMIKMLADGSDRAINNGWEVKAFRRDFDLPESELSKVIFGLCLGVEDGGFHMTAQSVSDAIASRVAASAAASANAQSGLGARRPQQPLDEAGLMNACLEFARSVHEHNEALTGRQIDDFGRECYQEALDVADYMEPIGSDQNLVTDCVDYATRRLTSVVTTVGEFRAMLTTLREVVAPVAPTKEEELSLLAEMRAAIDDCEGFLADVEIDAP